MIRVAINGFGRIGRVAFRVYFEKFRKQMAVVAINDLADAATLGHLLKFDTAYGVWDQEVLSEGEVDLKTASEGQRVGRIEVGDIKIPVFATKDAAKLPWKDLGVDVVVEATGKMTSSQEAGAHLTAGAKRVVISAPADHVSTVLLGVADYDGKSTIINNASCTTNSIAPVAAVMLANFGVKKAMMTTVHAYTGDQSLQDKSHKDLRRARAAGVNIIPTTTGAAIATTEAIPELKGKFDGMALRVPVLVGSISDITFLVGRPVTKDEVNEVFDKAAQESKYRGILAVTADPVVSSDIVGRSESAIVDLSLTQVVDGDMVKVFVWYDNEFGYSNRLIEQVIQVGESIK